MHFLQSPKNSKLNLLNFIPFLLKLDKYFESLVSLISSTISQFSQIENAVALEISQSVFLHATNAFLLSILQQKSFRIVSNKNRQEMDDCGDPSGVTRKIV